MLYGNNIYSNLGNYAEIPANESYAYPLGYAKIMAETAQNDLALFSTLIKGDFEEISAIREGYEGFSENVILEAASGIFGKIIEFFKAFIAKIKGYITGFFAKFNSVVMKDNKAFFDKYKKIVNNAKWEGFKTKFSLLNADGNGLDAALKVNEMSGYVGHLETKARDMHIAYGVYSGITNQDRGNNVFDEDAESRFNEELEDNAMEEHFLGLMYTPISDPDWNDYEKDFHESVFDDEEEIEGNTSEFSRMKSLITETLGAKSSVEERYKKGLRDVEKAVKKIVDGLEKTSNKVLDNRVKAASQTTRTDNDYETRFAITDPAAGSMSDTDRRVRIRTSSEKGYSNTANDQHKVSNDSILRKANAQYQLATKWQNAILKINKCQLDALKFNAKQCRSAYAAMVAFAAKPANKIVDTKESTMLQFAYESAAYEFDTDFDLA